MSKANFYLLIDEKSDRRVSDILTYHESRACMEFHKNAKNSVTLYKIEAEKVCNSYELKNKDEKLYKVSALYENFDVTESFHNNLTEAWEEVINKTNSLAYLGHVRSISIFDGDRVVMNFGFNCRYLKTKTLEREINNATK